MFVSVKSRRDTTENCLCKAKPDAASRERCEKERAPGFMDIAHERQWSLKVCRVSIAVRVGRLLAAV